MSNLLSFALRYLDYGLAPIPLWPDRRKNPKLASITEYFTQLPTRQEWLKWANRWPDSNIGLITGYWRNHCCLDFDDQLTFDTWLNGNQAYGHTWIVQTARGYHVWFQTIQDPGKSRIFTKDGLEVLVRSRGGYCIVPPSRHWTGRPYHTTTKTIPVTVTTVSDILTGWTEKVSPSGETVSDRAIFITPTKVHIENLIPPIKEYPNARGAFQAWCPFHDDHKPGGTPSAWVNPQEQRFGCNKCWPGLWWDVVNVYAMLKNLENGAAFKELRVAA